MSKSPHELIHELGLVKHPEGGYFVETDRQEATIPSPFADERPRALSTAIYYLLTPDSPAGFFHRNKSVIYHVLHQGRSEYTLIAPGNKPAVVETRILGTRAGETRMLVVPSNVWRRIRLLPGDEEGCLTTEVTVPGFHWEDHAFMTMRDLEEVFRDVEGGEEKVKAFAPFVKD